MLHYFFLFYILQLYPFSITSLTVLHQDEVFLIEVWNSSWQNLLFL